MADATDVAGRRLTDGLGAMLPVVAIACAATLAPAAWAGWIVAAGLGALLLRQRAAGRRWTRRATAAAARLAGGDFEIREPETGPPHARRFARSVNRAARENAARARALTDALAEAARQRDRLASIFTASSDGLLLYDANRGIVAANPRVGELLGFTPGQLSSLSAAALSADLAARCADPDEYHRRLAAHFRLADAPHEDQLVVERPRRRVLKRLSTPVLHEGRVAGRVFTYTDVTAEADVDQLKNEFVATASHELRTPLTSVHAALQVVLAAGAPGLDPEDREMLDISIVNTERLVRLVNDLLDLSKITASRMPMTFDTHPVAPALSGVIQSMRAFADQRGIALEARAGVADLGRFDHDHLVRVLTNLVSNAIKYSPAGSRVTLDARRAGEWIEIGVTDQGPGIPADQVDRLFRPFSRVGAHERQITGGTGLGLAISHAIVEQHGGRLWWEPHVPAGSRFAFTIPLARPEAASAAPAA